jgi:MFS family permease
MTQTQKDSAKNAVGALGTFAIMVLPFVYTFEGAAIGSDLQVLSAAFPDVPYMFIQYVMNVPFLAVIPMSIITGKWLVNKFDKRNIAIVGLFIYAISGILPGFANDIPTILALRVITGIGAGMVLPLCNMMISETWEGTKRERMLGASVSVQNISSTFISIIVGFLSVISWRCAFYMFTLVLVVALIAVFWLPHFPPVKKAEAAAEDGAATSEAPKAKQHMPAVIWFYALLMTVNWIFLNFVIMNLPVYAAEFGIVGGLMGLLVASPGLFSIFFAAIADRVHAGLKRFFPAVALFGYAIGFLILSNATNFGVMEIACVGIAWGSALMSPFVFDSTAAACEGNEEVRETAFGIVTPCIMLGSLLEPSIQVGIAALGGTSSDQFLFFFASICLFVLAVLFLIFWKGTPAERAK